VLIWRRLGDADYYDRDSVAWLYATLLEAVWSSLSERPGCAAVSARRHLIEALHRLPVTNPMRQLIAHPAKLTHAQFGRWVDTLVEAGAVRRSGDGALWARSPERIAELAAQALQDAPSSKRGKAADPAVAARRARKKGRPAVSTDAHGGPVPDTAGRHSRAAVARISRAKADGGGPQPPSRGWRRRGWPHRRGGPAQLVGPVDEEHPLGHGEHRGSPPGCSPLRTGYITATWRIGG